MSLKSKKKESARTLPADFPITEEIVSRDYEVDINTLVKATNHVLKNNKKAS